MLGCFGLTFVSAILPWVNAEIIVLSLPLLAPSPGALAGLVLVATAGQMTGKCLVYGAGRKGGRFIPERARAATRRWGDLLRANPRRTVFLLLASSVVGVPPFYVMSLVAGALEMRFSVFLIAGTVGRLARFGTLALVPQLFMSS
jgi:membrane protein YqaA with SNARE-associated domain